MRHFVFIICVSLFLVSCSSSKVKHRTCPQVVSVHELDEMADHGREAMVPDTLVATALMKLIEGQCEYDDDGAEVSFNLHMEAKKGPRLGGQTVSFPYFVSLVSPSSEVISKEIMSQEFEFEDEQLQVTKIEPLRVFIPLLEDEDAANYRVLLGFQLTPEQLKFIRDEQATKLKK